MKKIINEVLFFCGLFLISTWAPRAQAAIQDSGAKDDIKDAGRSTKSAVKKTAHKTKRTVKRGTHKSAKEVDKGAKKVEDKTR